MTLRIKICGLTSQDALLAADEAGADFLGIVFYPPSPRYVPPIAAQKLIAQHCTKAVAVTVNPTDSLLEELRSIGFTWLQLHGDESPDRVRNIHENFSFKLIKAIPVATDTDILRATLYQECVDLILFDAPAADGQHGGTGKSFAWELLAQKKLDFPWFLSGGLSSTTLEEAVSVTGARYVDVSSHLESRPGVKDIEKIRQFMQHARQLA